MPQSVKGNQDEADTDRQRGRGAGGEGQATNPKLNLSSPHRNVFYGLSKQTQRKFIRVIKLATATTTIKREKTKCYAASIAVDN